ncbi:NADH dehydrogenase [ubiquinone] 1 beta subcomplex subunit 8, mitochondrial [Macrosteles quadrilineatus]|uniref:NADH dehydrogenase [ubiquinone] 1 beta subcomplex subunit 8, mitochondrial n=1 Tax=Macrosteles quadrilineatus TaxID=74068 RepID=UPI0023E0A767|nr:NADH dehydrogenase [ubiquinone] 1 beta subcomplex subunit 8, mitochondrial [Macrosteles quadrilineatus]
MNVIKGSILKSKLPNVLFAYSRRGIAAWNKDFMPGPYPKTPEEKAAAAKKYGLLPEEYYADPEGKGDYPVLPNISGATKSDVYNWDHPHLKKDFNETMHLDANIISEDRLDCNLDEKSQIPNRVQFAMYIGILLFFFVPIYLCDKYDIKVHLPHAKRQFPSDGPHYKYPSNH